MALFGLIGSKARSRHERSTDKFLPTVTRINALESKVTAWSDQQLQDNLQQFKGKKLKELLQHVDEIFAIIREGSRRCLSMRHFDVQLLGGLALLEGSIAEMKTGEGKTLVATLPLILHALSGQGAHLITVNDYLAKRDAAWMGAIYNFFGLTVGVVVPGMSSIEKRAAYAADITYGTNNEFGFDYLRDNMAATEQELVQRELSFGIVDEVDSILIDEARTPLIISAPDSQSTKQYQQFAQIVPSLRENDHFNIDEKRKAVTMTDAGIENIEELLHIDNLYAEAGLQAVHHLEQALRAEVLYHKDRDYVVRDGQVIIVDEFTGRLMEGRRYADGLHQAIEAKERVAVQQESRTLATITFQNFFRLYPKLSGMTGTAVTSAEEFEKVYNLEVMVVPTNNPLVRLDKPDRIYSTEAAKFRACVVEIKNRNKQGQPVLVGTISIEKSEYLSAMLQQQGITHEVLNAKHHSREADIIARAGQMNAVTISTNMAGRGTDIKLGPQVAKQGGLFVLGTERHEARRIDNQLRGRSGRQGDMGSTQFFVSLEDDVMRVFGGDRIKTIMQRLKVPEDEPIENKLLSRALEKAQERVEGHYFDARKQVLAYDDVLNRQRNAIYTLRRGILLRRKWQEGAGKAELLHSHLHQLILEEASLIVSSHTSEGAPEDWDIQEIAEASHSLLNTPLSPLADELKHALSINLPNGPAEVRTGINSVVQRYFTSAWESKQKELGPENTALLAQAICIRAIDTHWMNHLDTMDYLRSGIGLRGYGQRDPLVEYQKEGYLLFKQLLITIKSTIVETIFKANIIKQVAEKGDAKHDLINMSDEISQKNITSQSSAKSHLNKSSSLGRNDPCSCGSGKKFKKCHGATA